MKKLIAMMMLAVAISQCYGEIPAHGVAETSTADNYICIADSSIVINGGARLTTKVIYSHNKIRDYVFTLSILGHSDVPKGSRLLLKFSNDSICEESVYFDAEAHIEYIMGLDCNEVSPSYILSPRTLTFIKNHELIKMRMEVAGEFLDLSPKKEDSDYIRESFEFLKTKVDNGKDFYEDF